MEATQCDEIFFVQAMDSHEPDHSLHLTSFVINKHNTIMDYKQLDLQEDKKVHLQA